MELTHLVVDDLPSETSPFGAGVWQPWVWGPSQSRAVS